LALRFMHAADLHLGSPFVGLGKVDGDVAELVRNATEKAFDGLIDACIKNEIDFLLVAGDVYDSADRTLRAQLAFRNGLRRLSRAGIRAYVVHGNHDPLDGWSAALQWPPGVHIFHGEQPEAVPFDRGGTVEAVIHGVSFPRREVRTNLARRFTRQDGDAFQIGLLHCNVGDNTGHAPYASCTVDDLAGTGLDYWALGHVHTRKVIRSRNPAIVYPGNLQGRHINESGPRGCLLVEMDTAKQVRMEFLPIDTIRWSRETVQIKELDSDEALLRALEHAIEGIRDREDGRTCICRLILEGRGDLHRPLRRRGYIEDLREAARRLGRQLDPLVWVDALEDRTRPPVDVKALRQAPDFLGDCLRLIDKYAGDADHRTLLEQCLKPLHRYLQMPTDAELVSLLDEVETILIDDLLGEDKE